MRIFFIFLLLTIITIRGVFAATSSVSDLRRAIEERAEALQKIQLEKEIIQKNLDNLEKSSNTLKKEIQVIDGNINQLNLSIKANKINLEKLELEIDALTNDIADLGFKMDKAKLTLAKLFTEIQRKDRENILFLILRNGSLSQSVSEAKSIELLNKNLSMNVKEFRNLQGELAKKLNVLEAKKSQRKVEQNNLISRQQIISEQRQYKQVLLNETKNQEKIYVAQLSEIEKLQEAVSAEIEKIEAELRKTIDPNFLPLPRPGVLLWPVGRTRITQGYGSTSFALRNYHSKFHNGVDFGVPLGTEVMAAEKGTVINVGDQDKFCKKAAYGKFVVIKHENGLTTLYAHLSKYIVSIDQKVEKGEIIGYVGRTGFATGPHLHFTVFATHTLTPARTGFPEGTIPSNSCGPMPVGGTLDPTQYL